MIRNKFFLITSFFLFSNLIFSQKTEKIDYQSEEVVWKETIGTLLREPLWSNRDSYDAGHVLMIPLHYAFLINDNKAISQFGSFFHRFSTKELPKGQLNQVHIIYLASRFLALKKQFGFDLTNSNDLYVFERILNYVHIKWNHDVAFQWGKKPFFGLKDRLEFVMGNTIPDNPSYYKAITDYELFIMAISSDLKYFSSELEIDVQKKQTLEEVNLLLKTILKERGEFTDQGGWLFQRGIWRDHKDFIYSGNEEVDENLKPMKRENIAEDSSHSHRWSLWLHSFNIAFEDEQDKEMISEIYKGLSNQFNNVVVAKNTKFPLINNFMDGHNGIYRYRYNTIGKNKGLGYGPYALSGILGEGWYCFLNNSNFFYAKYVNSYPLKAKLVDIYVGPNTTRDRNPLFIWPDFFKNGLSELIANQAYEISKSFNFTK